MTKKTLSISLDEEDQERLQREIDRRGISRRKVLLNLIRTLPLPQDFWAAAAEERAREKAAWGSNSDHDRCQALRF